MYRPEPLSHNREPYTVLWTTRSSSTRSRPARCQSGGYIETSPPREHLLLVLQAFIPCLNTTKPTSDQTSQSTSTPLGQLRQGPAIKSSPQPHEAQQQPPSASPTTETRTKPETRYKWPSYGSEEREALHREAIGRHIHLTKRSSYRPRDPQGSHRPGRICHNKSQISKGKRPGIEQSCIVHTIARPQRTSD
jgi:hypothetical protein